MRDDAIHPPRPWLLAGMSMLASASVAFSNSDGNAWTLLTATMLSCVVGFGLHDVMAARGKAWRRNLTVLGLLAIAIGVGMNLREPGGRIASLDVLLLAASATLMPVLLAFAWVRRVELLLAILSTIAVIVSTTATRDGTLAWMAFPFLGLAVMWAITHLNEGNVKLNARRGVSLAIAMVIVLAAVTIAYDWQDFETPVSTLVNSPKNDVCDCIAPLTE